MNCDGWNRQSNLKLFFCFVQQLKVKKALHTGTWQNGCTNYRLDLVKHKLLLDTGATDNISRSEISYSVAEETREQHLEY